MMASLKFTVSSPNGGMNRETRMRQIMLYLTLPLTMAVHAEPPQAPGGLVPAAQAFLGSLSPDQRAQAILPFNSEERLNWHFFPKDRPGLSYRDLTEEQKAKALEVLGAALSASGYDKVEAIRSLEIVLREIEGPAGRDPDWYYLNVFGEPTTEGLWGLRYEGHHISLNWTFADGRALGDTPQFLGAHPAHVTQGPLEGTRPLALEEDLARTLVHSLSDEQRAQAVLDATAPPDILTGTQREAAIQEDRGIAYARLTEDQQGLLLSLIEEYASCQPRALAEARLDKIRGAGLDTVKFAWMGGLEPGQGHYYRVQGPTFLIEYDNTQHGADHIHSVWRDFEGDFGRDLLKEHYHRHADADSPEKHAH
jgi:hypothetical protein